MGIREQKAQEAQTRRVKVLHLLLSGIAPCVKELSDEEKHTIARMVGNSIFDMRPIWSGYESQALVDAKARGDKITRCPEHYYPRQVAGKRIVDHIARFKGISRNKLEEFLDIFCRVHYTTSEENIRLKPFQKTDTFISPEHSYESANITLVKVK